MGAFPNGTNLVLSASYPSREYKTKADSHEIAAATRALTGAAFQAGWGIVFGGHPTISPLILMIAREFQTKNMVTIYQSAFFSHHISPATLDLAKEGYGRIEVVANHEDEPAPSPDEAVDPSKCPRSLTAMRTAMVLHPGVAALVLIGGDSGLREELALFRSHLPDLPVVPVGHPGGFSRDLFEMANDEVPIEPDLLPALKDSRNYLVLFSRVMRSLATAKADSVPRHSCFISYSSKDQKLAELLHMQLKSKGARVWLATEDPKMGEKLRQQIDEAIQTCDQILLVLSQDSLRSGWVESEVKAALEKERRANRRVLFPIQLDDAVLKTKAAWVEAIRRSRDISDFRKWKNHHEFQKALTKLMRDLAGEKKRL